MDWQRIIALSIVGITVAIFLWVGFRPRRFNFERDTHCGCVSVGRSSPQSSIVFHARKGERPQVVIKMK